MGPHSDMNFHRPICLFQNQVLTRREFESIAAKRIIDLPSNFNIDFSILFVYIAYSKINIGLSKELKND